MKFETRYRQLLHTELDNLVDISNKSVSAKTVNKFAFDEFLVRKIAFDYFLRSCIGATKGSLWVVDMLESAIIENDFLLVDMRAKPYPNDELVRSYELTIALIKEMISKIEKE